MAYARTYDGPGFAPDLVALFRHQLTACALQPGELCVAITDSAWMPAYAAACVGAAEALGADAVQATFGWNTAPDARALNALCEAADLIVYMTSHTLHYRPEIAAALNRGAACCAVWSRRMSLTDCALTPLCATPPSRVQHCWTRPAACISPLPVAPI